MAEPLSDQDLAAAIAGREHWRMTGEDEAVYDPGEPALVRVGRIANPPRTGPARVRLDRFYGVVVRDGRALHRATFGFAHEVVRWAERQKLT